MDAQEPQNRERALSLEADDRAQEAVYFLQLVEGQPVAKKNKRLIECDRNG